MTTPTEFKQARLNAGLTVSECARLLSIDPNSVRRMEFTRESKNARTPAPLMMKVLDWYTRNVAPDIG